MIYSALRRLAVRHFIARNVQGRRGKASRALVSYIVHPFLPFDLPRHHTNVQEARALTEILDEAGFAVDVVDSRASQRIVARDYDLYFGFGSALEEVAQTLQPGQRLIAYATGRAAPYQTAESMRRGFEFQRSYGVFPTRSLRLPGASWHWQITKADALLMVGDQSTASTFDYYPAHPGQIRRAVPATYSAIGTRETAFARDWETAKSHLLWFGGAGVVHKGLDLCIAALNQLPGLTLHVCGVPDHEGATVAACLSHYPGLGARVKIHGFVHPHSHQFEQLASRCAFALLPSCSEGQATSILTCVARGGLIPLVSDRCGCSEIPNAVLIQDLSVRAVAEAIQQAVGTNTAQLADMSASSIGYVRANHNIETYKKKVRALVDEVLCRRQHPPCFGKESSSTYRVYSLSGKPIFAVPSRLRRAALQRFQPSTVRRTVYRRLLDVAMFADADKWLGMNTRSNLPLQGPVDFDAWLENMEGELGIRGLSPAVFWPPQGDRGRIYVHLFDGTRPIAFAKMSLSDRPDIALTREGQTLRTLYEQRFASFRVPRVIAEGSAGGIESKGCTYLLMEPLPLSGRPIRGQLSAYPTDTIQEYCGPSRYIQAKDIPTLSWWPQYRNRVGDECTSFDEELATLLKLGVNVCRAHGDLSVNNIVSDGGRLWIFDWEESRADAPERTDEIGFALSTVFRAVVRNPETGVRFLRKHFLQSKSAHVRLSVMMALAFRHSAGIDDATAIIHSWSNV